MTLPLSGAALCRECPGLCHFVCPALQAAPGEHTSPRGMMMAALALGEKPRLARDMAPLPFNCAECGACERACAFEVPVGDTLRRARQSHADAAPEAVRTFLDRYMVARNASGRPLAPALKTVVGDRLWARPGDVAYFPGASLAENPERVRRHVELLRVAGGGSAMGATATVGLFPGADVCAGAPLWRLGAPEFPRHALRVARAFQSFSALIVADAEDRAVLRQAYREVVGDITMPPIFSPAGWMVLHGPVERWRGVVPPSVSPGFPRFMAVAPSTALSDDTDPVWLHWSDCRTRHDSATGDDIALMTVARALSGGASQAAVMGAEGVSSVPACCGGGLPFSHTQPKGADVLAREWMSMVARRFTLVGRSPDSGEKSALGHRRVYVLHDAPSCAGHLATAAEGGDGPGDRAVRGELKAIPSSGESYSVRFRWGSPLDAVIEGW